MIRILMATVTLYYLPLWVFRPEGVAYFLYLTTCSTVYVLFLDTYKDRYVEELMAVEIVSIAVNLVAALLYLASSKTAYIYTERPAIMTACFIAELAIIGARILYVGDVAAYLYNLRHAHFDAFALNRNNMSTRQGNLCTTPAT